MILGDAYPDLSGGPLSGPVSTLDDMFRRALARHPDEIALIDPPNRESFTDGAPRTMTYAQADAMISAIAGRLRRLGLSNDAVVAIQLPNTVEGILSILGVLRAGMIAAPLPLLWRQADCVAALSRVGVKALITCGRIGQADHGRLAMEVAAEIFPIRYVCGFGVETADGVVPLDDLFDQTDIPYTAVAVGDRNGHAADHLALITWDVTPKGLIPVPRSHRELMAAGLAVVLECPVADGHAILSSLMPTSFCGFTLGLMPWLLNGGTLVLHHPFDPGVLAEQLASHHCALAILPGSLIPRLSEAGVLVDGYGLKSIMAVWRAPERIATSPAWRKADIALADVLAFGETAMLALRRDPGAAPCARRRADRRTHPHLPQHPGRAGTDGAARRLSARRGAQRRTLHGQEGGRLYRHRLSLPGRCGLRRHDHRRPAGGRGQRRRLPLRYAGLAESGGAGRPHDHAGRVAGHLRRASPRRQRRGSPGHARGTRSFRRQSAGRAGLPRTAGAAAGGIIAPF